MNAEEIKDARVMLGLTQSGMASAMGVHRVTYTKWERGENAITAAPATMIRMLLHMQSKGVLSSWLDALE